MAKRTYKRISSYLSYKYFSRVNREKLKEEYKERTGRDTARGWQFSPEFQQFKRSEQNRIKTYAERNPEQFVSKKDTILRNSVLTDAEQYVFSDSPSPGAQLLNPMKGSENFGPMRVYRGAQNRAARQGKNITTIFRIKAPEELGGDQIATSAAEVEAIRGRLMASYGQNVASGKAKGSYGLIGADYSIEYHATGSSILAIAEIEFFLY